jgi:DNA-binding NarL/FixJ family response regulator
VACEALEILGRVVRASDLTTAEELFERARIIADGAGLVIWRLRALHELGTIDLLGNGRADRLEAARQAAVDAGALFTLAVIDLHLGDLYSGIGWDEEAVAAATRCVELSRRLGLSTLPAALCHLAGHHMRLGRLAVAEELLAEAVREWPDDPDVRIGVPMTRGMYAIIQADYHTARLQFDLAAAAVAEHPTVPFPLRGIWALLCTAHDAHGAEAREAVRTSGALGIRAIRAWLGYADAIALGQAGRAADAESAYAEADRIMRGYSSPDEFRHVTRPLIAEAALRDCWGSPDGWLRDTLAWCEANGRDALATHCRDLLKRAGEPVPRRGRGTEVSDGLRALGVTARELEVLDLVAEGLSNAEIGERLYISPRTVEKHVEKLLSRTGTRTRGQLAVKAERLRMG